VTRGIDRRICGGGAGGKDDRPNLHEEGNVASKGPKPAPEAQRKAALQRAEDVAPIIAQLRAEGASLRQIAEGLNARGVPAPKGGRWSALQVIRAQSRMRLSGARRMSRAVEGQP
jgi:hypothetical protein